MGKSLGWKCGSVQPTNTHKSLCSSPLSSYFLMHLTPRKENRQVTLLCYVRRNTYTVVDSKHHGKKSAYMNGNKCIDLKGRSSRMRYMHMRCSTHQHKKDSQMYYIVLCREMQLRVEAFFGTLCVGKENIFGENASCLFPF